MADDTKQFLPKARTEQLIVKEVDDEVLVYDLKTDQAHCLNKTAALVWKNCDGLTSVEGIADAVAEETSIAIDSRMVWLALGELQKFSLIEKLPTQPGYLASGVSRRAWVKNIGVTAIALPAIFSITASVAQAVGSCLPTNAPCSSSPGSTPCCTGLTCQNPSPKHCA